MVLNKINKFRKDRGFTIVELLIVIVVIGILAAIVIVAYSGITARANLQKSVTNATAMRDVAEAFNADNSRYPSISSEFTTGSTSTHLPTGITVGIGGATTSYASAALAAAGATTTVDISTPTFFFTGTAAASTGGVIIYWDPTTNLRSTTYVYYGAGTATSSYTKAAS